MTFEMNFGFKRTLSDEVSAMLEYSAPDSSVAQTEHMW